MRRGSSGAAGSKDRGAERGGGHAWRGGQNRLAPQGPVKRLRLAEESQELAWTGGGGLGG